ncbi:hypothetical protein V8F06_003076 [Rhypophila decipiens]
MAWGNRMLGFTLPETGFREEGWNEPGYSRKYPFWRLHQLGGNVINHPRTKVHRHLTDSKQHAGRPGSNIISSHFPGGIRQTHTRIHDEPHDAGGVSNDPQYYVTNLTTRKLLYWHICGMQGERIGFAEKGHGVRGEKLAAGNDESNASPISTTLPFKDHRRGTCLTNMPTFGVAVPVSWFLPQQAASLSFFLSVISTDHRHYHARQVDVRDACFPNFCVLTPDFMAYMAVMDKNQKKRTRKRLRRRGEKMTSDTEKGGQETGDRISGGRMYIFTPYSAKAARFLLHFNRFDSAPKRECINGRDILVLRPQDSRHYMNKCLSTHPFPLHPPPRTPHRQNKSEIGQPSITNILTVFLAFVPGT